MSKQVDERVVSMQFDNSNFEKNVKTSMSTLDKLKQSLKFDDAGKSFEKLNTAAKNVNLNSLSNSVETVKAKFSALDVVAISTIKNITDSAYSAGTKLIKSLSVDNISAGWEKFGEKTRSVGTLIGQGYNLDYVNEQLDRLNWFTDETSYNFTDMTSNIAKFTATGKDLQDSVTAMEGIALWAAASGQNAQKASSAMYQLSQALSAGYMRKEDYKSIQNVSMDTDEFRQKALDAAVALGTLKKTGDDTYQSLIANTEAFSKSQFAEHLTEDAWFTSDVMMRVYTEYASAVDQIYEYSEKKGITASEAIDELGDNIDEFALKVFKAGQEARTWSDVIDSVKDAVSTGWMNTFELIFGNYEQATKLWTDLANSLYDVFAGGAENRNAILSDALGSKWDKFIEQINKAGISTENFQEKLIETAKKAGIPIDDLIKKYGSLEKVISAGKISKGIIVQTIEKISKAFATTNETVEVATNKLEHFQELVNKTIQGDFGNGVDRINALTEAGENYATVQELVNKVWERNGRTWKDTTITADDLTETINDLSESELQNIGYTEKEAKQLKELAKQAAKTGTPLNELIENLSKPSGRELLIDSFKNAFGGLISIIDSFKEAWSGIFTADRTSAAIYNLIEGINKLSQYLVVGDKTADKLKRTFKGLFALIDIVSSVIGGPLKLGFKAITKLLGMFDLNILDVTASVGDAIVAFRDWLFEGNKIAKGLDKIIEKFKPFGKSIKEWIKGFKDADNIGEYFIQGLISGFQNGIPAIWDAMIEIGKSILESIKEYLGIHSPSTKAAEIGRNIIEGLIIGIKEGAKYLWETITTVAGKLLEIINSLDFGTILATGLGIGTFVIMKEITDIVKTFSGFTEQLSGLIGSAKKVLDSTSGVLVSFSKRLEKNTFADKAKAVLEIAIAIGILAGSLYLISKIDKDRLWESFRALTAIVVLFGVFVIVVGKLNKVSTKLSKEGGKFESNNPATAILSMAVSLYIIARAIKKVADIDSKDLTRSVIAFIFLLAMFGGLIEAYGKLPDTSKAIDVKSVAKLLTSFAISMILLSFALKIIGTMTSDQIDQGINIIISFVALVGILIIISDKCSEYEKTDLAKVMLSIAAVFLAMSYSVKMLGGLSQRSLEKGLGCIILFAVIIASLMAATKVATDRDISKLSGVLLSISGAMLIMSICMKILGSMSVGEIVKGGAVIAGFALLIAEFVESMASYSNGLIAKVGGALISFGAAMLLMAFTMKIVSSLSMGEIKKGIAVIGAFSLMINYLVKSTASAGKDLKWVGPTILMFAGALTLLTIAIAILSNMDAAGLARATAAITVVGLMMSALVAATKNASGCLKELITLTVALGILAIAIGALSFIDQEKLITASACISAVIGMFALLVGVSKFAAGSMKSLIVLTVAIGLIAGAIYLLSNIDDPKKSLYAAGAIGIIMATMALSLSLVSTVGKMAIAGIVSIYAMVGVISLLSLVLSSLAELPITNTLVAISAITVLLLAMSVSFAIISSVGILALAGIPAMYAMVGVVALLGTVLQTLSILPVESTIGIVKAMSVLLLAMSASCTILAAIGLVAPLALLGILALVSVVTAISGLLIAIGYLTDKDQNLEEFLNKGIPILNKIGEALGTFFGNIVGGFLSVITESAINNLIKIGNGLSEFGNAVSPFMEVSKAFDSKSVDGMINLVKVITALTGGNILELIVSYWTGRDSVTNFATQIKAFGEAIVEFSNIVSGNIDTRAITAAAKAGKNLAEMAEAMPKTGGIWQDIIGVTDIENFGKQISAFIGTMIEISGKLSENNINTKAIIAAANAGKSMAEFADALPKEGGAWQVVAGEQDIQWFGWKIESFIDSILLISEKLKKGTINEEGIKQAIAAGKQLLEFQDILPKTNGWWQEIAGEHDIADFGAKIAAFAESMKIFSDKLAEVNFESSNSAVAVANNMADVSAKVENIDDDSLKDFGNDAVDLAEKLEKFSNKASKIDNDKVSGACDKIKELIEVIKEASVIDASSISEFTESFNELGNTSVDKFIDAFDKGADEAKNAGAKLVKKSVDAIEDKYDLFYSAGKYVVEGFADGISAKSFEAEASAAAMAKAAYNAAKNALDINSPSKIFRRLAYFVPEGFANGIDHMSWMAEDSAVSMAETAINSTKKVISKIVDTINSDVDTQPTIRPVVDLSDVKNGASSISSLFSGSQSIGVLSNVRSINSMMNQRQNGTDNVVSAIKDLGSRMDENSGNTYNINGVSYEEGSDVSDAIRTLVRAVKIDRRS